MSTGDETLTRSVAAKGVAASYDRPHLFLVLDCDRPRRAVARIPLAGISRVRLGRGDGLTIDRVVDGDHEVLDVKVPNRRASREHAEMREEQGVWSLFDLGGKNGTYVNGARIDASAALQIGDVFEIGHAFFIYGLAPALAERIVDPQSDERRGGLTLDANLAQQLTTIDRVACTNIPMLVHGETGSGKEVMAQAIHDASGRTGRFVAVNCGAIPANLVESQLFGHKKGAFSGAVEASDGLVRAAAGGTLFLDEIGDLPLAAQTALLRVIEEEEVLPVGATTPVEVDFRLVAATHRDLESMQEEGTFREDLFARLSGFTVRIPPLRDRRVDLGLLIRVLLDDLADGTARVSVEAARAMLAYAWPRNVRELRNALRAALAIDGDVVTFDHLPEAVRKASFERQDDEEGGADERARLIALLEKHNGNVAAVARELSTSRMQIHREAKRMAIDFAAFRKRDD